MTITPEEALRRGWSIIPTDHDKRPLLKSWKPYQNRRPTPQELADWAAQNPASWAMITGTISGRITLDFDGEAGCRTLESLGLEAHRKTPSGGFHADFQHPGWRVATLNGKSAHALGARWPGLDIRADGGYVVFTGRTKHGQYVWLRDAAPHDLDILPEDLREFLGLLRPPPASSTPANGTLKASPKGQRDRVDSERLIQMALDRADAEGRNNGGIWLACQLRDNGYSISEGELAMRAYRSRVPGTNIKGNREEYTEREMIATLREAYSRPPRQPWGRRASPRGSATPPDAGQQPERQPNLLIQPYTDTGNAERLVGMYGRDIRFCGEMKTWLVWDGRRWNSADTRRVKLSAKLTIREMHKQAATLEMPESKAAEAHARRSESAKGIAAMLTCAEYEGQGPVSAAKLDQAPYLLNLLNGTLDLKTCQLREHRREDLITKLVHFKYNPQAECPRFMRFIHRIMGDGPDASDQSRERSDRLVGYLQKCFGYSLTGDVSEKAVFCFFDAATRRSGNNGKTTLLEIIRFVLAEYSAQVLIDSLMMHQGRESSASLADLADLRGARFVTTSEAEEGQKLAVGKLKYLTQGMGEIKTCRKYENPITFIATHKLFLDANHKPVIRGTEKAVWNRLKPIPFTVAIDPEEIDKTLLEKLKAESEGILAWMVEGFRAWMRDGLGNPPEVLEASASWQAESDRFPVFLEEKCVLAPEAWVPVSQPWSEYQTWCELNNEKFRLSKSTFDEKLEEHGCKRRTREHSTVRAWIGIRFRTPGDDRTDEVTR